MKLIDDLLIKLGLKKPAKPAKRKYVRKTPPGLSKPKPPRNPHATPAPSPTPAPPPVSAGAADANITHTLYHQ